MEQLCSHSTDFHEIWYLSIFQQNVEKIQVALKSEYNNGVFYMKKYVHLRRYVNHLYSEWKRFGQNL